MRNRGAATVASALFTACVVLAGPAYASGASLNTFSNGFETNTNGWCDQPAAYGPCDGVSNGTLTRVMSGSTGFTYANGVAAEAGSWYARTTGAPDPMDSACTPNNPGECFGPYTDFLAGVNASFFPPGGFTTSLDIYLDTSFAATHRDVRFDWDTAMNDSSGNFLQDYAFNVGTSPANSPAWFVNAATNAGRGSSFPENACPSPSTPPNSCRAPATITTSGWYRFVHRFFNDGGDLGVEMYVVNEATGTKVPGADWTIVGTNPSTGNPEPIGDVGGPFAGYFPNEEISGLPIDNSALIVPLVTQTQAMDGDLKVAQGSTLSAGYDFTMPGNHPTATVGFSGSQATFNATCASGTPGSRTIVVSMPDQSYTDPMNNSAWFPSGDQNASSTYQGSTTVPSFCDSGALVRLQQGGTFSTSVSSTDTTDKVNIRWHYKDGTGGGWSGTFGVTPG